MNARVFGGLARSSEGWTDDLDFEACDAAADPRITTAGGANRTRVNGAGSVVAASGARVNHTPLGRTNTLKSSVDMSDAAYWLQNAGGWWTSSLSFDKAPPVRGAKVTKYVRTAAVAGDSVFARCMWPLILPAGARSASLYVYVSSGQGVTSWRINADWEDVEQGTQVTSTLFDQWVRINSTATLAAIRAFLDYCIAVNGGSSPSTGFTFYCAAPQESDALTAWIATGATPVTVYDSLGLLQEPELLQRIVAPNDVSNVAWSSVAITTPAADTIRETAATAYHYLAQIGAITAGAPCVMRGEFKPDGRSAFILQIATGGDAIQAAFDMNNLATGGYVLAFGLASSVARRIVALPDGWFLAEVSGIVSPALTSTAAHVFPLDESFNALYAGDVTKGLKMRNINFGPGRFATSPVLSAATASPSTHFINGAAFAQYFANQGTYLIEFTPYALTNNEVYWGIGQASVFNNSMYLVNSAGSLYLIVYSGGVNTAALDLGVLVAGTRYKVAISYQAGEIAARCNGGTERVSGGAMPAVIDTEGLLTTPWNGGSSYPAAHMHRRRFRPYPSRGQLYQLTA